MQKIISTSAHDVEILSVLITSDRLDREYEVVQNVTEINVYEHLDNPYLTASVMIADSSNLLENIGFLGTENVTISLKIKGDDRSIAKTKEFVVTDVRGVAPINDYSEAISLSLIEKHAYVSRLTTVSKAYQGKAENIIANLMYDHTQKRVDVPDDFSSSAGSPLKVVIPSMTPLKAARWLRNRMVTEAGSPYFLYSTLNGPNLFLVDLDHMLIQRPINQDRPYSFGQAFTNETVSNTVDDQARVIESYMLSKSENMFKMAADGILNSTHQYYDLVKSRDEQEVEITVSMAEAIEKLKIRGILSREQSQPIYDNEFTILDKKISEYNTAPTKMIMSSNTFQDFANYYEAETQDQQQLRAYSLAMRHYLLKSPLEIVMPGFDFLGRGDDITIGKQIALQFFKNDPAVVESGEDPLDKKRTGNYIIYTMRHIIQPEKYSVSMSCVKLGERNG